MKNNSFVAEVTFKDDGNLVSNSFDNLLGNCNIGPNLLDPIYYMDVNPVQQQFLKRAIFEHQL